MTFGWPQAISKRSSCNTIPLEANLDALSTSPSAVTSPEAVEAPRNSTVCFFKATIQLYTILGTLLSTTYADNCEQALSPSLEEILETSLSIDRQLSKWEQDLPFRLTLMPWHSNYIRPESLGQMVPIFERLSSMIRLRFLHVRMLSE
ncbi:hypothetical protein M409DRAFT_26226 [Zasmidium cellare ATCC 36951]|uniref:Uncharacterized protein n=1 Tax=Zasmidium cellare ATCC 36951 TaxID=1080233 RepID=A0A6A6CD55_ZASCE|nr:uncharacterized protein M409DRAFT_26226 [Zasmidium cellare ATCC 36951]KAF2163619.1 hypothetical protein M409DRAFT_26226 [Zasmidium cellare ATCC 36951]